MVTVQMVGENDIKALAVLEKEIFSDSWSEKSLWDTYMQKQAAILGAWADGKIVGYAIIYYVLDEGEIARIAVKEPERRKGVAGQIIAKMIEFCMEKEIGKLMLDVRKSNAPAISFYKKCGFSEDGIRKNFYENPKEDALLMSKVLGK